MMMLRMSKLYNNISSLKLLSNNFKTGAHGSRVTLVQQLLQCRSFSDGEQTSFSHRMSAWNIYSYGCDQMTLSKTTRVPSVLDPGDVLVDVHAASVNPIDVMMRDGYGEKLINLIRWQLGSKHFVGSEFPLILGRDFSGTVVSVGKNVTSFQPGDEVWGVVGAHNQGSHAQFCVASTKELCHKPSTLTHIEAASLPYVALTAWSALCSVGEITQQKAPNLRVFIQAGSGGIGTFAVQLMSAWGAHVTSTCSTDAIDLVRSLGANVVIDYKTQNEEDELRQMDGFHLYLDVLGKKPSRNVLKNWCNAKYVTIKTPFLEDTDTHGVPAGFLRSAGSLGCNILENLKNGQSYRWAFFIPDWRALRCIGQLVDNGQIKPVIDKVFPFHQLPHAYNHVEAGHSRGKTVIDVKCTE
ncbi:reticulon-4-interacting protein 1 homolog, mitochondrial [Octopus bimaculoides]|uniref:Enoyl reductase (ER) domain-containing protein n=1 Tax=Octopus bimaculoides TaxID=37653 RepID=A0A0L8I975_OCTBM|nr:reticulon-4-interacting protein 1 homolog, mitochondrial [Octopus bimaculoides]|eukprot:XP_014784767.1 PREDICTED: reticulon-4-interacting protein 1 homolog, mitochondrial-like [Octopus bimaculoides]